MKINLPMPATRRAFLQRLLLVAAAAATGCRTETTPGAVGTEPGLSPDTLLAALRQGGCTVYVRHAQTDRSRDDAQAPDWKDCSTQRLLSPTGEKQADDLGAAIHALGIPVGLVKSSPYCRARETARRAFPGHDAQVISELARLARTPREKVAATNAKLRELLSTEPKASENDFIVCHYENLVAIQGPDLEEAGMAIFRPSHGTYELLGRLNPAQWQALAQHEAAERQK